MGCAFGVVTFHECLMHKKHTRDKVSESLIMHSQTGTDSHGKYLWYQGIFIGLKPDKKDGCE